LTSRYGPPSVHKFAFTLTNWAKEPENVEAWKEIMDSHKLTHNPFDDVEAHFPFADGALMAAAPLSLNKARRYGWTGYVDTLESIWVMFNEMSRLHMLPPMQVNDPRPCI
jgi:hypothetical protein